MASTDGPINAPTTTSASSEKVVCDEL
jgi:hypothetical protein